MTVPAQRHAHADGCLLDPVVDDWVCPRQRTPCTGEPCTCGALVTPWSHAPARPQGQPTIASIAL